MGCFLNTEGAKHLRHAKRDDLSDAKLGVTWNESMANGAIFALNLLVLSFVRPPQLAALLVLRTLDLDQQSGSRAADRAV